MPRSGERDEPTAGTAAAGLLREDGALTPDLLANLVKNALLLYTAAFSRSAGGGKPTPALDAYVRALVQADRRHKTGHPQQPEPDGFRSETIAAAPVTVDLVTVRDVVDQLGCSRQYAGKLFRLGRIPGGRQVGGRWVADAAALAAYRRRGGTGGEHEEPAGPG